MHSTELKTVYITKYALTAGILEYPGEIYNGYLDKSTYWKCYTGPSPSDIILYKYNEGFLNKDDAIENAERKRAAKLKSLKEQINKLNNLKFI